MNLYPRFSAVKSSLIMSDRFTKHSYQVKSTCEWEKTCESHLSWCYPNNCYISSLNWIMGKHAILLIKWRDRVATRKKSKKIVLLNVGDHVSIMVLGPGTETRSQSSHFRKILILQGELQNNWHVFLKMDWFSKTCKIRLRGRMDLILFFSESSNT